MQYEYLVRLAQDREPWRIMTANLLKEDAPDDDDIDGLTIIEWKNN